MNHLEFLTVPTLRNLRKTYKGRIEVYARSNWNTNPSDERRYNQYRTLLREVEQELLVRNRDEITQRHG